MRASDGWGWLGMAMTVDGASDSRGADGRGADGRRGLVVGGGIAGAVLALALHRAGVPVVVAEGHGDARTDAGGFVGLAPNGVDGLRTLGVAEDVLAGGLPCGRLDFRDARGRRLANAAVPQVLLRRGELVRRLYDQLARSGIELQQNKRLVSIDTGDGARVTAHFADATNATADFLVGCDGVNSRTRRLVLPDAPAPAYTGMLSFGGITGPDVLAPTPDTMLMVYGRRAFFAYHVTDTGEVFWFANVGRADEPAAAELDPSTPAGDWRQRLGEVLARDVTPVRTVLEATPGPVGALAVHDIASLPVWHTGRVGLMGDAAHTTSPHVGQGASLAIEDGVELARCLRDHRDPGAAFTAFRRLRADRVERVASESRRVGSVKSPRNPAERLARDLLLRAVLPRTERRAVWMHEHRIDWDAAAA